MKKLILLLVFILTFTLSGCGRPPMDRGPEIARSDILFQHNKFRSIAEDDQLSYDPVLEQKAQAWAEWMANNNSMVHSHLSCDGSDFIMLGENIAMGYEDIDAVMDGWMNSTGHRQNILNRQFTHAGFGYAKLGDGTPFWCAQFGARGE